MPHANPENAKLLGTWWRPLSNRILSTQNWELESERLDLEPPHWAMFGSTSKSVEKGEHAISFEVWLCQIKHQIHYGVLWRIPASLREITTTTTTSTLWGNRCSRALSAVLYGMTHSTCDRGGLWLYMLINAGHYVNRRSFNYYCLSWRLHVLKMGQWSHSRGYQHQQVTYQPPATGFSLSQIKAQSLQGYGL